MEEKIGTVSHFFDKAMVAAIKLDSDLKVGETIRIKGATTDFVTEVESMQIDREDVEKAGAGDEIGIKVNDRVRGGDAVYKVEEE